MSINIERRIAKMDALKPGAILAAYRNSDRRTQKNMAGAARTLRKAKLEVESTLAKARAHTGVPSKDLLETAKKLTGPDRQLAAQTAVTLKAAGTDPRKVLKWADFVQGDNDFVTQLRDNLVEIGNVD
jgi:hypothetical protein